VIAVIELIFLVDAAESGPFPDGRHREILGQQRCFAFRSVVVVIVVSERQNVRHSAIEHLEALAGHFPLGRGVVLRNITQMHRIGDVASLVILGDPLCLGLEVLRVVVGVAFRVGQNRQAGAPFDEGQRFRFFA